MIHLDGLVFTSIFFQEEQFLQRALQSIKRNMYP